MRRRFRRTALAALAAAAGAACSDRVSGPGDPPGAPRALEAWYYAHTVHVTWELPSHWNGEVFRVYSRRASDADYFLIAEVTNCSGGFCSYADINVAAGVTYLYFVAAVDPRTGEETPTAGTVQVHVPEPTPPPVPAQVWIIALDGANYIRWGDNARSAGDFSHYRVWLVDDGTHYILGETDSEGFLDLLARNGLTYTYVVTSVDDQGHESEFGQSASGTPRPDFHSEWIYDYFDLPASSGFRFQESEDTDPLVHGDAANRHFRLEVDQDGWWLVPGPSTEVYPDGFATTALKCGVAADSQCQALEQAPTSGYVARDVGLAPQTTYAMRVRGDDGEQRYGVIRIQLLGFDGSDRALMIFDWAYQLQPGNPNLSPRPAPVR